MRNRWDETSVETESCSPKAFQKSCVAIYPSHHSENFEKNLEQSFRHQNIALTAHATHLWFFQFWTHLFAVGRIGADRETEWRDGNSEEFVIFCPGLSVFLRKLLQHLSTPSIAPVGRLHSCAFFFVLFFQAMASEETSDKETTPKKVGSDSEAQPMGQSENTKVNSRILRCLILQEGRDNKTLARVLVSLFRADAETKRSTPAPKPVAQERPVRGWLCCSFCSFLLFITLLIFSVFLLFRELCRLN